MGPREYIDETGFVRKPRQLGEVFGGTVGVLFVLFVIGKIFGTVSPITGIFSIVSMGVLTYGITNFGSSHKVDTWRHRRGIEAYIYLAGCLFIFPGILMYYYFKAREKAFLKKQRD